MIFGLKNKNQLQQLSIRDFHGKRNKILLIRNARGIGDILNCRMLFKNFKTLMPDLHLTFACFGKYKELVEGHPYLDAVVDVEHVRKNEYIVSYDISRCCINYESQMMGQNKKHRCEIWAEHCGLPLQTTDMMLPFIDKKVMQSCYLELKQTKAASLQKHNKNGKSVLLAPLAYEFLRSLTKQQLTGTVELLRKKNLFVYGVHNCGIPLLRELEVPVLSGKSLAEWMGYIHAADYVVTVDTGTFHYAGGINKPMVGIFTHVDGKLRGKYYDFILVQKHRDNGDWPCGPCYNYLYCTHKKCENPKDLTTLRPCVTELTLGEIETGVDKMLEKWAI
jgi:hypothetical protein